jgi:hypothetical protein
MTTDAQFWNIIYNLRNNRIIIISFLLISRYRQKCMTKLWGFCSKLNQKLVISFYDEKVKVISGKIQLMLPFSIKLQYVGKKYCYQGYTTETRFLLWTSHGAD